MFRRCLVVIIAVSLLFVFVIAGYSDSGNHLKTILDKGVIRVGMIPDNQLWSTLDSKGNWNGFDADVARLLAEALGVKIEYIATDGASRIPLILTDKVDIVISCFTAINERAKSIGFTIPYVVSGILPLCRKDNMMESWDDLVDKKICVARGSTLDFFATETFPDATILRFDSIADTFLALQTGKADVLLEEDVAVLSFAKNDPNTAPMNVEIRLSSYVCMGVAQDDQIWINFVNHVIQNALHSGQINELYKKNFGKDMVEMLNY